MNIWQILLVAYVIGAVFTLLKILLGFPIMVAPKVRKPISDFDLEVVVVMAVILCALWPLAAVFLLTFNALGNS